jgi:hypothetical protein
MQRAPQGTRTAVELGVDVRASIILIVHRLLRHSFARLTSPYGEVMLRFR